MLADQGMVRKRVGLITGMLLQGVKIGEADVRYICGNKMRQINIDDLMYRNTFDWFKEFSVVPECLEDIIRDNKKAFMCRSLL